MLSEERVQREFAKIGEEFSVVWAIPVRRYSGAGEGTLTYKCGAAYCTADWWDHGCFFTLLLGRSFEIGGRSFVSEFPIEALGEEKRRVSDRSDIGGQIDDQFRLLRLCGRGWLAGDFSREPFIKHKVHAIREQNA
jgi:hypothetical protein